MTKQSNALMREPPAEESAEWRPFHVWQSQVRERGGNERRQVRVTVSTSRESWDPFAVWKRHVRR